MEFLAVGMSDAGAQKPGDGWHGAESESAAGRELSAAILGGS